jgi:DNA-binding beta-propeller fold protein YncE
MKKAISVFSFAPSGPRRLAFLLAVLLAATSCGKDKEKPSAHAGEQPAPGSPAPTETAAPERRPTILARAAPNQVPYSGLNGPRGATLDDKGRLWVANFGKSEIWIFDPAGGYLGGWGNRGLGDSQFKDPCAIAVRGDDVYVADTWNGRVALFSTSGQWKARAPGDFYGPRGIAAAPDGKVWIADTGNQRLAVCEKNLSNRRFFGKRGSGPEEFQSPVGVAVGGDGSVYVADAENRRIQILDSEGHFKTRWKFSGWGPNTEPYLAVDADGSVYATDPAAGAVVLLNNKGSEVRRWTVDDAGKKFELPTGIALDSKGRTLYVVNTNGNTIVRLNLSKKP